MNLRHSILLVRCWTLLLAACLAACAAVPPAEPVAAPAVPATFKQPAGPSAELAGVATAPAQWWLVFADPALNDLVERAKIGNNSVQTAAARLSYAKAVARQSQAARQPVLALNAGVSRQQGPLLNAAGEEGTRLTAAASVAYEADVMGRLARAGDAAALDAQARAALLDALALLVQTQVAQTYLSIRALDEEISLTDEALQGARKTLDIQQSRQRAGSISALALERLLGEMESLLQEQQVLQRQRSELENALAVLLGENASGFALPRAAWISPLPAVRAGLPANVLLRRPDVAAALNTLQAAELRLGVARTSWMPNLTLTGAAGYASPELRSLFAASMQSLVLGAVASLPVFDGGRREANEAMAEAEFKAAASDYRERVLQALREVEDQLVATRTLALQAESVQRSLASALRRTELAASSLRNGLISQAELLDIQADVLRGRKKALQIRAAQFQASVALIRALGGVWTS